MQVLLSLLIGYVALYIVIYLHVSQRPETSQCGRRLLRRHGRNQPKACRILSTGQQRSDPED